MAADATIKRGLHSEIGGVSGYTLASGDTRPVPDPTTLTTQLVDRATGFIREIYDAQLNGIKEEISSVRGELNRLRQYSEGRPLDIHNAIMELSVLHTEKIAHLATLTDERFSGLKSLVQETFSNFKTLVDETNKLNKTALDAAFAASKEVVATQQTFNDKANTKSEASFTSQIGEVTKRLELNVQAITDKIEAANNGTATLDRRLTSIESSRLGAHDQRSSTASGQNMMIAVGVLVILIAEFAMHFIK